MEHLIKKGTISRSGPLSFSSSSFLISEKSISQQKKWLIPKCDYTCQRKEQSPKRHSFPETISSFLRGERLNWGQNGLSQCVLHLEVPKYDLLSVNLPLPCHQIPFLWVVNLSSLPKLLHSYLSDLSSLLSFYIAVFNVIESGLWDHQQLLLILYKNAGNSFCVWLEVWFEDYWYLHEVLYTFSCPNMTSITTHMQYRVPCNEFLSYMQYTRAPFQWASSQSWYCTVPIAGPFQWQILLYLIIIVAGLLLRLRYIGVIGVMLSILELLLILYQCGLDWDRCSRSDAIL